MTDALKERLSHPRISVIRERILRLLIKESRLVLYFFAQQRLEKALNHFDL